MPPQTAVGEVLASWALRAIPGQTGSPHPSRDRGFTPMYCQIFCVI